MPRMHRRKRMHTIDMNKLRRHSPVRVDGVTKSPECTNNGVKGTTTIDGVTQALSTLNVMASSTFDFEPPASGCPRWPGMVLPNVLLDFISAWHLDEEEKIFDLARVEARQCQAPKKKATKSIKPVTTAATTPSPFTRTNKTSRLTLLDFPAELREMIYEHLTAITSHETDKNDDDPNIVRAYFRQIWHPRPSGKGFTRYTHRFPLDPSLALVNRQLRHEVLSLRYRDKRLLIGRRAVSKSCWAEKIDPDGGKMLKLWTGSDSANYVREIELSFRDELPAGLKLPEQSYSFIATHREVLICRIGEGFCQCSDEDLEREVNELWREELEDWSLVKMARWFLERKKERFWEMCERMAGDEDDGDEDGGSEQEEMPVCEKCRLRYLYRD